VVIGVVGFVVVALVVVVVVVGFVALDVVVVVVVVAVGCLVVVGVVCLVVLAFFAVAGVVCLVFVVVVAGFAGVVLAALFDDGPAGPFLPPLAAALNYSPDIGDFFDFSLYLIKRYFLFFLNQTKKIPIKYWTNLLGCLDLVLFAIKI
jgi:hypothetical protein